MTRNAIIAGLAALSAACNSGGASPSPAAHAPAKARDAEARTAVARDAGIDADLGHLAARPLYITLCAPCHGADGKGYAADHAPSLVNPTFLESASDEFLRQSIAAGRPGTSMAAYGRARGGPLDDAAVARLVGYLREQGPPASPLPAVAGGDPATGAAVYAQRCVRCHGDARTRGEAMSLVNPGLLASASDGFLRHAIVRGRPGTPMEAFAGVLSDAEIAGVIRYLRTAGAGGASVELLPEPTGKEPLVLNPAGKPPLFTPRADPCPPAAPGAPRCTPDPRFVSVAQVAAAVADHRRLIIIDARPASEWRRVHIAGAVSIPYHELARLAEVPRDGTWVIAYCACPHHLSGIVVDELRKRGYAHSAVLDEGINEWQRRGLPITAAAGVPRPPDEPRPPRGP